MDAFCPTDGDVHSHHATVGRATGTDVPAPPHSGLYRQCGQTSGACGTDRLHAHRVGKEASFCLGRNNAWRGGGCLVRVCLFFAGLLLYTCQIVEYSTDSDDCMVHKNVWIQKKNIYLDNFYCNTFKRFSLL